MREESCGGVGEGSGERVKGDRKDTEWRESGQEIKERGRAEFNYLRGATALVVARYNRLQLAGSAS